MSAIGSRHPVRATILLCLCILSVAGLSRLETDMSFRPLLPPEDASDSFVAEHQEKFGNPGGRVVVIAVEAPDTIFREPILLGIQAITHRLSGVSGIERVYSITNATKIIGDRNGFSVQSVIDLNDPTQLNLSRAEASTTSNPLLRRRLVSADGKVAAIVGQLAAGIDDRPTLARITRATRAAASWPLPTGVGVHVIGGPVVETEYAQIMPRVIGYVLALCGVVLSIILLLAFSSSGALVAAWTCVLVAELFTFGLIGLLGVPITIVSATTPLFVLIIALAEVTYLTTAYARHAGYSRMSGMEAMRDELAPCTLALVTTGIGFGSFVTAPLGVARGFGIAMAAGSASIAGALWLTAPWMMRGEFGSPRFHRTTVLIERFLDRLGHLASRWSARLIGVSLGVVALLSLGIPSLKVMQRANCEVPPQAQIRQDQLFVETHLAGIVPKIVSFKAPRPGGILEPQVLGAIERLQTWLEEQEGVLHTWSIVQYLKQMNQAMHEGRSEAYQLPDSKRLAAQYLLLHGPGDVENVIDSHYQWANLWLFTRDMGSSDTVQREKEFLRVAAKELPGEVQVHFVGDNSRVAHGADEVPRLLLKAFLLAFPIVFLTIAASLRSWRAALVAVLPNLLPMACVLGTMGWLGINLRIGTALVLAVSFAIADSDTIHLLVSTRRAVQRAPSYELGLRQALQWAGFPMIASTAFLIAGLACFGQAEFLAIRDMGLISAVALLIALFCDLLITPALLSKIRPFEVATGPHGITSDPP